MVKKENSQNIEEIIKKAVRAEIQNIFEGSINKEEPDNLKPAIIPRNKTSRTCYEIPKDDVICDCGKDITKFTKQQNEMHNKSRFHLENTYIKAQ